MTAKTFTHYRREMNEVVTRDPHDLNTLLHRACGRILGTQPGTPERAMAEKFHAIIWKNYQLSESLRLDLKIAA